MSDLFTDSEKIDLLFKRMMNKVSTTTSRAFFQEPNITNRSFVYQEDMLAHAVPSTCPTDIKNLSDSDLDDRGNNLKGSYAGKTSSIDSNIRYYHKIPLEAIAGTGGASFQSKDATQSHPNGYADGSTSNNFGYSDTYGRVFQNSLPFNYASDGSYNVSVYKSDGTFIPFGSAGGGYVIEERGGVVTFFQYGNVTNVDETKPILVSFFKYVGNFGGVSQTQVNDMVTASTNEFQAKQIFTGGTDNSSGDLLTAIQIDTRDISALSDGQLMDAIQIGGNYANSWRIVVQKSTDGSRLMIQSRDGSGNWTTKTSFTSP